MQRIFISFIFSCAHTATAYTFWRFAVRDPYRRNGFLLDCWCVSCAVDSDRWRRQRRRWWFRNMDDRWNGKSADRHHFKRNIDRKWIFSNLFRFYSGFRLQISKKKIIFISNKLSYSRLIVHFHFFASDDSSSHILGSTQLWFLLLSENRERERGKKRNIFAEWPIEWKSRVSTFTQFHFACVWIHQFRMNKIWEASKCVFDKIEFDQFVRFVVFVFFLRLEWGHCVCVFENNIMLCVRIVYDTMCIMCERWMPSHLSFFVRLKHEHIGAHSRSSSIDTRWLDANMQLDLFQRTIVFSFIY